MKTVKRGALFVWIICIIILMVLFEQLYQQKKVYQYKLVNKVLLKYGELSKFPTFQQDKKINKKI